MERAGATAPRNNGALWLWVPGRASLARDDGCGFGYDSGEWGYDGGDRYSAASCATVGWVPATVARRMSRGCDWS
ncbi:hypothetical protein M2222_007050 [Bradyrhizobium elkanii]|jgi:hypothetical protein|nr:hypothetical protein [Bradyrhizobium elkanii]MCS3564728.1 hypothetical protein [Bradyrhizobium elkanii]MCW2145441.1 hypothetical protein [Bradyrhizobium elkanii]MCW2355741.1 hypothetical protein [Bradyrhizobium elkanii]MCW2378268.1 hypothetical protein [Bradyrhizobium elkanii]